MHWVIQENYHYDAGTRELIEVLERAEIPHTFHKVIPFIGEIEPDIELEGPVICIGSYSMRHVAKKKGWKPGVYDLNQVTMIDMVENWGRNTLNHDAFYAPFKVAHKTMRDGELYFIRPIGDSKIFSGCVLLKEEIVEWQKKVAALDNDHTSIDLTPDTYIMVARPRTILKEYRTWIVNNKVITASQYKVGGRVVYSDKVDQDVINFAQDLVYYWKPHEAYVLDIALTYDGLKAIEINTLNAAGFYAADMNKLVQALEEYER